MSYPYQLWLATFGGQIPDQELHAYWNLKDEDTPTHPRIQNRPGP